MGAASQIEHELATIKAFVTRDKQERFSTFLSKPKNRKKNLLRNSRISSGLIRKLLLQFRGRLTQALAFGKGTFKASRMFIDC